MAKKRGPITAAELMKELHANPEYMKMMELRELNRQKRQEASRIEQLGLTNELAIVGVSVSSVWELVKSPNNYMQALPILLRHLRRAYSPPVREGIARALAVAEARYAWKILVSEYIVLSNVSDHRVKSAIAVALSAAATPDVGRDLIKLAKDRQHGTSRLLLLLGLKRLKSTEAAKALRDLEDDPDLEKEISSWTKKKRSQPKIKKTPTS